MSMSHKAYAFDWRAFEADELHAILLAALEDGDVNCIKRYINAHRDELSDPYAGEPLDAEWETMLKNRDVHEYGDFALTRFYDPSDDQGLANDWIVIDSQLRESDRVALLGTAIGPNGRGFDPGRQGTYFQTPERVADSSLRLEGVSAQMPKLRPFVELLRACALRDLGVYVTF